MDLELILFETRLDGTTIPLYDKRIDIYQAPAKVTRTAPDRTTVEPRAPVTR
ncbi:MAG TPA: hypothetical protein VLX30_14075 [Burkholderiales bacterium]|nr:hypothetical protein [Burkholderiales bacterium]